MRYNKTYQECDWVWSDPELYVIDPGERMHDCLRAFYKLFQGEPTLYIIDDCSATKALTKKKDMFHCKDRDSFDECLRENDVIPVEERAAVRQKLSQTKHAKLVLKTDQPATYQVLCWP